MLSLLLTIAMTSASLTPTALKCESIVNPIGIDVERPRLSWIPMSSRTGARQTAYEIRASKTSDPAKADLWATGKVSSSETLGIPYSGAKLKYCDEVHWQVRLWDEAGNSSDWSEPASFTAGLLTSEDMKAKWIGATESVRKGIGFHAAEAKSLTEPQWVQIDLGAETEIDSVVLHPVRNHLTYLLFGYPLDFTIRVSQDSVVTKTNFPPPVGEEPTFEIHRRGRYVRVDVTKLFRRNDGIGCFALSELEVMSNGRNVALGKTVTSNFSVERNGWTKAALVDGYWKPTEERATLLLRKEFKVGRTFKRALAFVCGLGQYEMRINGNRVGDAYITPSWTQYAKSCVVDTYDVTKLLQKGENALGLHLGNGMYDMSGDTRGAQQQNSTGPKKAIVQLELMYDDGHSERVVSDHNWTMAQGPETYSGVFGGEDWDQRLYPVGWDLPGFHDGSWHQVLEVSSPGGELHGITHAAPPLHVIEIRKPIKSTTPKANTIVLDLGQNAPYVPEVAVQGKPGQTIRMWPAEVLKPDGTIDQQTIRAGKLCSYTAASDHEEIWHPGFWYCGSRYWQIEASDAQSNPIDPATILKSFNGLLVHSSAAPTGTFECSNDLLNRIYTLIHWAIRSNLANVISDCPHREKSGWLEELHLMGPSLLYCYDLTRLFPKAVYDMRDAQHDDGRVPTMAPEYFFYDAGFADSVEWGGSYLLVPSLMMDWYADSGNIETHFVNMARYVEYLRSRTKNNILSNGLGDWNGYGNDARTPVALTDTAYYYVLIERLAKFAKLSGRESDADLYMNLAEEVRKTFNQTFYHPESGKYDVGSQSSQATALDLGLVPENEQGKVFQQLLKDVADHDYAVSCGEVGHASLLRVLAQNGRSDVVAKIHMQTDKPGYGYQLRKGNTSLAEAWDASPISQNHFMLGQLMEWLYGQLLGIQPDPEQPGFRNAIIRPQPVDEVTWARGSYDSVRGRYSVFWNVTGKQLNMDIEIPANCTASVSLPKGYDLDTITSDGGKTVSYDVASNGALKLPSGKFHLTAQR